MAPRLSVVLLTLNEERDIGACLDALAGQQAQADDFEVILIDAASDDRTVPRAREAALGFPVPFRLEASSERLPIGAARNLGVRLARAPAVAFLSADARPEADWVARALAGLRRADMVFGRQVHTPHRWTMAAAVRGLRYHFPAGPARDPLRFASNVAAAFDKQVLLDHPFDDWANAAEDLLLAQRAARDGRRAVYDPGMVVHHHDVSSAREELRKNLREGRGCGLYADELGIQWSWLAWGTAVAVAASAARCRPRHIAALAALLWAPTLRRAVRRRHHMPTGALVAGVAASPAFDVAFLVQYLRGLSERRRPGQGPTQELTT